MLKYRLQVVFYSGLAALAIGLPIWRIWAGGPAWLWGSVLLTVIPCTLYLLWVYRARLDVLGTSILRGQPGGGRIALTFDDGPNSATTLAILDILERNQARATFFCIGSQAAAQPDVLRRMARQGHAIGNHTQDHRKLAWLSRADIAYQIDAAQKSIAQAGVSLPVLLRAPHGFKSPFLPGMLRQRGMQLCAWSQDIQDFHRPGAAVLLRRALAGLRDGEIMLLHDGGGDRSQTVEVLEAILVECKRRGLEPVTVPEILSPPTQAGLGPMPLN